MKKLVVTALILCAGVFVQPADAAMIILDYQGDTIVTSNNIERTLMMTSDDGGNYYIAVKPLDEFITNNEGTVQIPLQNFFINNNKMDVWFKYNEYSNLFKDANMIGPKSITAKIRDYGIIPAGVYNLNLEVQATDIETMNIVSTSVFNLQFIIPPYQELNLWQEEPVINISASDAFTRNKKITAESAPMVYITSNTDWILSLDASDFGEAAGNYYVRTVAASGKVTNRLQERALIDPNKGEIILARGKAPANNETVSVEFSVEGKNGNYVSAGSYTNNIKYILREGEK